MGSCRFFTSFVTSINLTLLQYFIEIQFMLLKSISIIFNKLRTSKFQLTSLFCLTLFFMTVDISKGATTVKISYTVTFPQAQAHYANVEMHIDNIHQKSLVLKMPVWTPGSYLVREY